MAVGLRGCFGPRRHILCTARKSSGLFLGATAGAPGAFARASGAAVVLGLLALWLADPGVVAVAGAVAVAVVLVEGLARVPPVAWVPAAGPLPWPLAPAPVGADDVAFAGTVTVRTGCLA